MREKALERVLRKDLHDLHTLMHIAFAVNAVEVFLMPGYAGLS